MTPVPIESATAATNTYIAMDVDVGNHHRCNCAISVSDEIPLDKFGIHMTSAPSTKGELRFKLVHRIIF